MEMNQYFNIPTKQKFNFDELEFTPINVEFFQNLLAWHKKDFTHIQKVLATANMPAETETRIAFLEAVTAMIHTATYPYVSEQMDRGNWKSIIGAWVIRYPELVTWFLSYLVEFMPTDAKAAKTKKSLTPETLSRSKRLWRWTGETSSTGLFSTRASRPSK